MSWGDVRRLIDGLERAGWEPQSFRSFSGTAERQTWTVELGNHFVELTKKVCQCSHCHEKGIA